MFSCQQNPFSALHYSSNFHRVQAALSSFYETKEIGGSADYLGRNFEGRSGILELFAACLSVLQH